jgi:hypothetical protein
MSLNKEGYLTKEGGSVFKNWKKRYFILDYTAGTLSYFESPKPGEKPLGIVIVRGSTVTALAKTTKGKDNCFVIANNEKSFFAFADSKDDADSWVSALKRMFICTVFNMLLFFNICILVLLKHLRLFFHFYYSFIYNSVLLLQELIRLTYCFLLSMLFLI